jgi:hypothetical protein
VSSRIHNMYEKSSITRQRGAIRVAYFKLDPSSITTRYLVPQFGQIERLNEGRTEEKTSNSQDQHSDCRECPEQDSPKRLHILRILKCSYDCLPGQMTNNGILARKTGNGGNAGLMESEENMKPFPSLPTVLGNR